MADRAPIVRPITHTQPLAPSRAGGGHSEGGGGLSPRALRLFRLGGFFWRGSEFGILYEDKRYWYRIRHFSPKKRDPPSPPVQVSLYVD